MIVDRIADAINKQINAELYSGYMYLAMSAYCSDAGIPGAANWLRVQAMEEYTHADRLYRYLISRNGRVILGAIEAPPTEWKSLVDVFERTLEHEQKVTAMIDGLVNLAGEEKDHATESFLQWFVDEQVEEEESAQDVLDKVKLAGGPGPGLFMVDAELGQRVFTPPPTGEE